MNQQLENYAGRVAIGRPGVDETKHSDTVQLNKRLSGVILK